MAAYFAERARGGVGMIITGGISPNDEGGTGAKLSTPGGGGSSTGSSPRPCMRPTPT